MKGIINPSISSTPPLRLIERHPMYEKLERVSRIGLIKLSNSTKHVDFNWLNKITELTLSSTDNNINANSKTKKESIRDISYTFSASADKFFGNKSPSPQLPSDTFLLPGPNSLGPITDIIVVFKGEKVPEGYKVIEKTKSGRVADLNYKNSGKGVFLAYTRNPSQPIVTGLAVILTDKGEQPPPEFEIIKKSASGLLADLNAGSGGHQIFLCLRRVFGPPLTDIEIFFPNHAESLSPGFIKLSKSVYGFPADLNGANNNIEATFIGYKVDLDYILRLTIHGGVPLNHFEVAFTSPVASSSPKDELLIIKPQITPKLSSNSGEKTPIAAESKENEILSKEKEVSTIVTQTERKSSINHSVSNQRFDFKEENTLSRRNTSSNLLPKNNDNMLDMLEDIANSNNGFLTNRRLSSMDSGLEIDVVQDGNHFEVGFAYMRWIFPFIVALYSRDKDIIVTALECLKDLITENVLFPPSDIISYNNSSMSPFDLVVACLYHISMMNTQDLYGEVTFFVIKCMEAKKCKPASAEITYSSRSVHRLYRTLLAMHNVFTNRYTLLEEKRRRAITIGRLKEGDGYGKITSSIREQMDVCHKGIVSIIECSIYCVESVLVKKNTELDLMLKDNMEETESSGVDAKNKRNSNISLKCASMSIDLCLERVELLQFTQESMNIFASHNSNSSAFASDFNQLTYSHFTTSEESVAFLVLMNLLKRVSEPIKSSSKKDYSDRIAGLEVIIFFLQSTGPEFRRSTWWMYIVRRIVVPVLLSNVNGAAINIVPIFRRMLQITSMLWKHFKDFLKTEMAVLVENFLIKILRSKHASTEQQIDIITELSGWCDFPQGLIEMFLNYDNDQSGQPNLVFLIVSTMIEICQYVQDKDSNTIGVGNPTTIKDSDNTPIHIKELQVAAQSCLSVILRAIMNASATVHLISHDDRTKKLSEAGWMEDDYQQTAVNVLETVVDDEDGIGVGSGGESAVRTASTPAVFPRASTGTRSMSLLSLTKATFGSGQIPTSNPLSITNVISSKMGGITFSPRQQRSSSVRQRHAGKIANQKLIAEALQIIEKSKSIKKGVQFLVTMNCIQKTSREVCNFLRLNLHKINEDYIGDYIGDGGEGNADSEDVKFMNRIREAFMGGMAFGGLSFDQAFRYLLTKGGFRLPGEAQKIDRIMEAFAEAYYKENKGDGLFLSADDVFNFSFSCIMLNTDLHNPNIRESDKMTLKQFLRQNATKNFPEDFQKEIYISIKANGIKMPVQGQKVAAPLKKDNASSAVTDKKQLFILEMDEAVSSSRAILAGQAAAHRPYSSKMSADLVRLLFEELWWDTLTCVELMYKKNNNDNVIVLECLDMIRYAISTSLFLGMEVERQAFAELLARISYETEQQVKPAKKKETVDEERRRKEEKVARNILTGKHLEKEWFDKIMLADTVGNVLDVIPELHDIITDLKAKVTHQKEFTELVNMQKKFTGKTNIVETSRRLLKEESLIKVCSTGQRKTYKFLLFNDILMYADKTFFGKLSGRKEIPLASLRLSEVNDPKYQNCFSILSPVKSFFVISPNRTVMLDWIRAIDHAIKDFNNPPPMSEMNLSLRSMEEAEAKFDSNAVRDEGFDELVSPFPTIKSPAPENDSREIGKDKLLLVFDSSNTTSPEVLSSDIRASPMSAITTPMSSNTIFAKNRDNKMELDFVYSVFAKDKKELESRGIKISDDDTFLSALQYSQSILQGISKDVTASDIEKLQFYGLFKQATQGDWKDTSPESPKSVASTNEKKTNENVVNITKVQAWKALKGMEKEVALTNYVWLLDSLDSSWRIKNLN